MQESVLVLDFGAQYTQLIARRIRECGVFSEIRPFNTSISEIEKIRPSAIILSGGPSYVSAKDAPLVEKRLFELGIPILGICYGMQLAAHVLGGNVESGESREFGPAEIIIDNNIGIFENFQKREKSLVWMSHGDHVVKMPNGFEGLASSPGAPICAFANVSKKIYGIQFHPEVVHTVRGRDIIRNFVFKISGCKGNWNSGNFIEKEIFRISELAPSSNVICGLSGGVDSTVAAVLVNKAIGTRLHCVLVDNGLMRKNEAKQIMERLGSVKGGLGLNLTLVDASSKFLKELAGVTDPEQKRKIIGRVFIEVFDVEAKKIKNVSHLVQGTLYPDVIESVSIGGPSSTIKTHHNVGGLPEKMNLKLIEPFRELFKDEVRAIGRELSIAEDIITRHPFPGPGLAVRILGEITDERLEILREADQIFIDEIRAAGIYLDLWQAFAVLLPIKSVGVMGDGRTYEEVIALRAVTSEDGMTANWSYLPEALLRKASARIINEVRGVNRVAFDISSKPPATIEWE
ncbi:MAG: glutamine-hydrolyzing GMP synthase [bacterium]|nr:glutamine-hydrolyzing GMP synthase [bacterium]